MTVATNRNSAETIRTELGADAIAAALLDNPHNLQVKPPQQATLNERCATARSIAISKFCKRSSEHRRPQKRSPISPLNF